MLTQHQVIRDLENERYAALIARIQANGRCPAAAHVLVRPGVVRTAALGLAILRLCEMTHGRAQCLPNLVAGLLACQDENGLFADDHTVCGDSAGCEAVVAATAIAVSALRLMATMNSRFGAPAESALGMTTSMIAGAAERGLRALQTLRSSPPMGELRQGWLIAQIHLPDVADLHGAFEQANDRHGRTDRHGRGGDRGTLRHGSRDDAELALARYARAVAA